jgi:hypothetical protein
MNDIILFTTHISVIYYGCGILLHYLFFLGWIITPLLYIVSLSTAYYINPRLFIKSLLMCEYQLRYINNFLGNNVYSAYLFTVLQQIILRTMTFVIINIYKIYEKVPAQKNINNIDVDMLDIDDICY